MSSLSYTLSNSLLPSDAFVAGRFATRLTTGD